MPPLLIRAAGSFLLLPPVSSLPPGLNTKALQGGPHAAGRPASKAKQNPGAAPIARQRHGQSPRGGGHAPPSASLSISCGGRGFFRPSRKLYYKLDEIFLISPRYKNKNKSNSFLSLLSGLWEYSEIIAICKRGSGSSPDTDLELPSLCNSGKYIVV